MSRNIIFVLMYHRHKLLERIQSTYVYTITEFLDIIRPPVFYLKQYFGHRIRLCVLNKKHDDG
jgi:hypothetical protein